MIAPTHWQIFTRFLRFGSLAWGGPVAQIAMIKRELVEEEQWVTVEQFNRALAVYQALPGPEAHELCVYFGMKVGGRWGGLLAGLAFMLPGLLLMLLAIGLYAQYGMVSSVRAIFDLLQIVVIGLIGMATYKIGKHALTQKWLFPLAISSAFLTLVGVNCYLLLMSIGLFYTVLRVGKMKHILTVGALFGILILGDIYWQKEATLANEGIKTPDSSFKVMDNNPSNRQENGQYKEQNNAQDNHQNKHLMAVFLTGLKGGLLTFGGAYTAIPFIQKDAVVEQQWLSKEQFLDGVAIANILPAPLVIFATFTGYFGGNWWGAILITLGMFLPSFAFTLIGFKTIENLIAYQPIHAFLDGVTAAVVGIIATTALRLALASIETPLQIGLFIFTIIAMYSLKSKFTPLLILLFTSILGYIMHHISMLH